MVLTFKQLNLSEAEQIWLKAIQEFDYANLDIKFLKVKLWSRLPKDFDHTKIDTRLLRENHLTLVGLWHVSSDSRFFKHVPLIIKTIRNLIQKNSNIHGLKDYETSELTKISTRDVQISFLLIYELGGFFGSAVGLNAGYGFKEVGFSKDDTAYDGFLRFENLEKTMEEFYKRQAYYHGATKSDPISSDLLRLHSFNWPSPYVDKKRIQELMNIQSNSFDLSKLIQLCIELNEAFSNNCYLSCALLARSIIDHLPPIFGHKTFGEVCSNYKGSKSVKESITNLQKSLRKIADNHLHTQIRKKDILPTKTQVNFSNDLDVLLGEVVRILK